MTTNESSDHNNNNNNNSSGSLKYEPEEYPNNDDLYDDPRYRYYGKNPRQYNPTPKPTSQRRFVPRRNLWDNFVSGSIVVMLVAIVSIFVSILFLRPDKISRGKITLERLKGLCDLDAMLKDRDYFIACERGCMESRDYCKSMSVRRLRHLGDDHHHGGDNEEEEEEGKGGSDTAGAAEELCHHYKDTCTVLNLLFNSQSDDASSSQSSTGVNKSSKLQPPPSRLSSVCSQSSLKTIEGFEDCKEGCSVASCCVAGTKEGGCYEANADNCDAYRADCRNVWVGKIATTTTPAVKYNSKVTTKDKEKDDETDTTTILTEEEKLIRQACSQSSTSTAEGLDQCRDACTGHMCCVMNDDICKCADKNKDCTLYESCEAILEHHTWLPILDDDCETDDDDEEEEEEKNMMMMPQLTNAQSSSP